MAYRVNGSCDSALREPKYVSDKMTGRKQKKNIDFAMILLNFTVFIPREDLHY